MLEKEVESKIVRYAKSKGVLTYKFSSPQQRGVPDRMFIYKGMVLFLEIKRPGGRPTRLQYKHMRVLRLAGVYANWCDTVPDGKRFIDALLIGKISDLDVL